MAPRAVPPHVKLLPATREDIPYFVDIFVHAQDLNLTQNFMYDQSVYKSDRKREAQTAFAQWRNEAIFQDPNSTVIKALETETNQILGYISWQTMNDPNAAEYKRGARPESVRRILDQDALDKTLLAAVRAEHDTMGDQTYIYLHHLYIRPSAQAGGLGRALLQPLFEEADARGLPAYVISMPESSGFYSKMGFEEVNCVEYDLANFRGKGAGYGVFRLPGMLRTASKTGISEVDVFETPY